MCQLTLWSFFCCSIRKYNRNNILDNNRKQWPLFVKTRKKLTKIHNKISLGNRVEDVLYLQLFK